MHKLNTLTILLGLALFNCAAHGAEPEPLDALLGTDAVLRLSAGNRELCAFSPGAYEKGWRGVGATPSKQTFTDGKQHFTITLSTGASISGVLTSVNDAAKHEITLAYEFTPSADAELNSLHVSVDFPVAALTGGKWKADDKDGTFPAEFKDVALFNGPIKKLDATLANGTTLSFAFAEATPVLLQDNRKWGPTFCIRIGPQGDGIAFKKGETTKLGYTLSVKQGLNLSVDSPVTLVAGPDWIPLNLDLEIESNSALDFSKFGFQDAPAGKHGRVIATPDGQFAYEDSPKIGQRFYGINLCFTAQYLTHEQADQLADRLVRIGYNAVRIHHYEHELTSGQAVSTALNPEKLDQLDYLLAAFKKRGIYITTDLFVSRPVKWKDVGIDKPGDVPMDTFKILVPVVPAAYENWKAFVKSLLDHTNLYTKLRYADEPALAWIAMINEGNFGNFVPALRDIPEWKTAWNAWLVKNFTTRDALAKQWGAELKEKEDPTAGTVGFPDNIYGGGARVASSLLFFGELDREMVVKMKAFLHDELKCKALVTNSSSWTNFLPMQIGRQEYDYVDDHFYVDHPQFIEKPWQLPSRCDNSSPIAAGAPGGRNCAFTRYTGKPFTITEYNYAAPGRYRGVGGILTGALASLQGWSGVWRFAFSHNRDNLFKPMPLGYFDMATDPLGQAAERASLCLFVRGDMKPATESVELNIGAASLNKLNAMPSLSPSWNWAAWIERVGTRLADKKQDQPLVTTVSAGSSLTVKAGTSDVELKSGGKSDSSKHIFQSQTHELLIDGAADSMLLDTPKTAGGYATTGKAVETADHAVSIKMVSNEATVWLSSLDDKPLTESGRILVTHLTDLQNTEIHYAEKACKTLLAWGKLPHLVRAGKADVQLKRKDAATLKVWALSTSGKRLFEVASKSDNGILSFTADVAERSADFGAHFCYEIAAK